MNERFLIAVIGVFGFIIIAFTSIVPVMLHQYGIDNAFVVRAAVGVSSLICGYAVLWGFFKKENQIKQKKEGKRHLRPIMLIAGVIFVALAWFTDVPLWIADYTGLSQTFTYSGEILQGGLGLRLSTSALTAVGVLFVRFSTYREKEIMTLQRPSEETYTAALENRRDES